MHPEHFEQGLTLADHAEQAGLVNIEVEEGTVYRITGKGIDEVEGNRPQPLGSVSTVFNIQNAQGSVIGTHNTANFTGNFDFSTVERRIEAEGGEDKEELREVVAELRSLLERGSTVEKGFLAGYNAHLKKHEWLADAVAGWLLNFSTQ